MNEMNYQVLDALEDRWLEPEKDEEIDEEAMYEKWEEER